MFSAADYGLDAVEVWPENWPSWSLFCQVSTQWRIGMGGPTGLDYGAIYPLLDRIATDPAEWMDLFEDIQTLERTALKQMSENRSDK